jgi:catecholate siderophore receptor
MKNIQSSPPSAQRRLPVGSETLSLTTLLCAAGSLSAQTATKPTTPATTTPTDMKEIVVEADAAVYNVQRLQSPKFTEPLRDVPQTITVIPRTVIEDRGAFSLREVLRNTPGVSMQAGEGGGGLPGDSLTIRGFSSRTDWFMDGVRDYGAYNRDPFNTEQVEITKGPSSSSAGRGSTGGSINMATKMANLERSNLSAFSMGSDNLYRATVDVNEPLGDHVALRLNGLYHYNDAPGRDEVYNERYGIAASLAFGLGTDTRFTLNYQHMTEDNLPDYGIPWVPVTQTNAALVGSRNQAPPVSFDTFYGNTALDFEDVQNDTITAILDHDFSDKLKLRNVTRYSRTHRHSVFTAPRFTNNVTTQLNRQSQQRIMTSEVFANQTNLTAEFDTGPLKHALVTGLEFVWERQLNTNNAAVTTTTQLFNPSVSIPVAILPNPPGDAESHLDTIAIYLFDTISMGRHFEINGGLRYDHLESEARGPNGTPGASRQDDLLSWKAGLVFKPVEHGSIYFGYGTSFNPSIDGNVGLGLATNLDPEESRNYELGTKWDLFNERLSITAALFRTEKTNARVTDPILGTVLGGNQVVDGIEFGISGSITDDWQIFAGYAYMQSETEATPNLAQLGQTLNNAPENTFNLWTTYNVTDAFQAGFGAQFVGDRVNGDTAGSRVAPEYWTLDAMFAYKVSEKVTLRLNIYNLADERYIDRVGGGHFVPGAGRSAALTASIKF